jgi:Rod binding domain-containing protein
VSSGSILAPLTQAPAALAPVKAPNGKTLEAAKQFEGMLMANLFQGLRKTVQPSGLFGNSGNARSTYEYLLDQAVVNHAMTAGKGWGLSERLAANWKLQSANVPVHE